jgi:hypothetical protein
MKRRPNLFNAFRRDRLAGLWLAALLLFVPYLQPLSEALAAGKPFAGEICSTFGTSGKAAMPGLADDCSACISGRNWGRFPQMACYCCSDCPSWIQSISLLTDMRSLRRKNAGLHRPGKGRLQSIDPDKTAAAPLLQPDQLSLKEEFHETSYVPTGRSPDADGCFHCHCLWL